MVGFGKNVVLVRDLTDTMYNPRVLTRMGHFRGAETIVEHRKHVRRSRPISFSGVSRSGSSRTSDCLLAASQYNRRYGNGLRLEPGVSPLPRV
jgi:hypothetical protein